MQEKENKGRVIISAQTDGKERAPIEVPPQGSLGLLALGYRGILAWREVRDKAIKANSTKTRDDKK